MSCVRFWAEGARGGGGVNHGEHAHLALTYAIATRNSVVSHPFVTWDVVRCRLASGLRANAILAAKPRTMHVYASRCVRSIGGVRIHTVKGPASAISQPHLCSLHQSYHPAVVCLRPCLLPAWELDLDGRTPGCCW